MPFTFSHPAIILPLVKISRKWFSLTGLVIGSLVPDFEYFIRMRMDSRISHTPAGLFLFDLPLGLLLTFVFHNVVRNRLYDNLPLLLQRRVFQYKAFSWNAYFIQHWWMVALSILIGAVSHLFWDGFTHNHAFFVELFPALRINLDIIGRPTPLYRVLQHISSFVGGLVDGLSVLRMPEVKMTTGYGNPNYWIIVFSIAGFISVLRLSFPLDQKIFPQVIVTVISATLIALVAASVLIRENIKHDVR